MTQRGLTVVEVLVALAILAVAVAFFTFSLTGAMRTNAVSGARTQAAQVLNYLGRRLAGGDERLLAGATPAVWGYGELARSFPDLTGEGAGTDPGGFRAAITRVGPVAFAGASAVQYRLEVCWRRASEHCLGADTVGPDASGGGVVVPLPGIN